MNKNTDIEILRGLSIVMVVAFHWPGWNTDLPLWAGVDLFLCISGYVITKSFASNPALAQFWIKRLGRIWPAALLWLALPLIFGMGNHAANVADAKAALLQVENARYVGCNYYGHGSCGNILGIYWSLSLEEQFYFLFPLLFLALGVNGTKWMMIALIAGQFFLNRPLWSPGWAFRSDAIAWGVLLALMPKVKWNAPSWAVIALLGLILIVPSMRFGMGFLAQICALLVLIASNSGLNCLSILKTPLTYLGSRSFTIYLAHQPAYWTAEHLKLPVASAFIILAVFVEITYRCIETPIRLKSRSIAEAYT